MFDTWHVPCYICGMIVSFNYKELKQFYETGNPSKLTPEHIRKISNILALLDVAVEPVDMKVPGFNLHKLSGNLKDFWSVKVDKNYRIIFRFIGEGAVDVDYIDYH